MHCWCSTYCFPSIDFIFLLSSFFPFIWSINHDIWSSGCCATLWYFWLSFYSVSCLLWTLIEESGRLSIPQLLIPDSRCVICVFPQSYELLIPDSSLSVVWALPGRLSPWIQQMHIVFSCPTCGQSCSGVKSWKPVFTLKKAQWEVLKCKCLLLLHLKPTARPTHISW